MSNMKPSEFAKKIGVSVKTLQRWDNDGTLKASRNPKGRRYYTEEQIMEYNSNNNARQKLIDALLGGYYDDFITSETANELSKSDLLDIIQIAEFDGKEWIINYNSKNIEKLKNTWGIN